MIHVGWVIRVLFVATKATYLSSVFCYTIYWCQLTILVIVIIVIIFCSIDFSFYVEIFIMCSPIEALPHNLLMRDTPKESHLVSSSSRHFTIKKGQWQPYDIFFSSAISWAVGWSKKLHVDNFLWMTVTKN